MKQQTSTRHPLDPELQQALNRVPAEFLPRALFDFDDMQATRDRLQQLLNGMRVPDVAGVETEVCTIPGPPGAPELSLRIHRREETGDGLAKPCLYWAHGGGMVIGQAADDDSLLQGYVAALDCVAVAVDYRLAPEHPYPAPVDDIYAGLTWTADHVEELGIDPARLAIGGASAGGGLAAGTALLARDRGGPSLSYQLLVWPMLDHRSITPSSYEITDLGIWDRDMNAQGWAALLGDLRGDDVPPYACPALAEDLAGLPPTFIDVGAVEVFRDECVEYASRLATSGVPVEFHLWPGAFHGFDNFGPDAQISRSAKAMRVNALERAFRH